MYFNMGNGVTFAPMPCWQSAFMLPRQEWTCEDVVKPDKDCDDCNPDEWRTTVMLRNMPNNYTRDMLLDLIDSLGFACCYDFAYLPVDFKSQAGLGYAFVNFISSDHAQRCFERLEGFS